VASQGADRGGADGWIRVVGPVDIELDVDPFTPKIRARQQRRPPVAVLRAVRVRRHFRGLARAGLWGGDFPQRGRPAGGVIQGLASRAQNGPREQRAGKKGVRTAFGWVNPHVVLYRADAGEGVKPLYRG